VSEVSVVARLGRLAGAVTSPVLVVASRLEDQVVGVATNRHGRTKQLTPARDRCQIVGAQSSGLDRRGWRSSALARHRAAVEIRRIPLQQEILQAWNNRGRGLV